MLQGEAYGTKIYLQVAVQVQNMEHTIQWQQQAQVHNTENIQN